MKLGRFKWAGGARYSEHWCEKSLLCHIHTAFLLPRFYGDGGCRTWMLTIAYEGTWYCEVYRIQRNRDAILLFMLNVCRKKAKKQNESLNSEEKITKTEATKVPVSFCNLTWQTLMPELLCLHHWISAELQHCWTGAQVHAMRANKDKVV